VCLKTIFVGTESLLLNLHATQTNRFQLVLNSAARAVSGQPVTKTPKFPILYSPTYILEYLDWLKINDRIE